MLNILEDFDLTNNHGFQVPVRAKYYVRIEKKEDLLEFAQLEKFQNIKKFFLGEGFNTLFKKDFDGIVVHICILGIDKIDEDQNNVVYKLGAGEDWHSFVEMSIKHNLSGIENLALIPSSIGSAVIQNIAAYGMEQATTFVECEVFDFDTQESKILQKDECMFSYRSSIFKNKYKDRYVVVSATYRLNKVKDYNADISYHSRYESLQQYLDLIAKPPYTLQNIFDATVMIRKDKLPSVNEFGTVGSVFLNPFVSVEKLIQIEKKFPGIQYYPTNGMKYTRTSDIDLTQVKEVKIAIGWILEELGWAGKWIGNVGTYVRKSKNALLVITRAGATADEVYNYILAMQKDLKEKADIEVKPEVVIV